MAKTTEAEARQALAAHGSPAADAGHYAGRLVTGGWAFGWRPASGPVWIGTIPWVVTDTGLVGGQRLGETAEQAILRLMESSDSERSIP